jgi:hypothetical protein
LHAQGRESAGNYSFKTLTCLQDFPTDGDDLLFERICLAIEFRYKNLAPELNIVIESLEPLARFLIRRAQLKGPYELLGRMNIASGAWQEHEAGRLKRLREAAENEKNENGRVARDNDKFVG